MVPFFIFGMPAYLSPRLERSRAYHMTLFVLLFISHSWQILISLEPGVKEGHRLKILSSLCYNTTAIIIIYTNYDPASLALMKRFYIQLLVLVVRKGRVGGWRRGRLDAIGEVYTLRIFRLLVQSSLYINKHCRQRIYVAEKVVGSASKSLEL